MLTRGTHKERRARARLLPLRARARSACAAHMQTPAAEEPSSPFLLSPMPNTFPDAVAKMVNFLPHTTLTTGSCTAPDVKVRAPQSCDAFRGRGGSTQGPCWARTPLSAPATPTGLAAFSHTDLGWNLCRHLDFAHTVAQTERSVMRGSKQRRQRSVSAGAQETATALAITCARTRPVSQCARQRRRPGPLTRSATTRSQTACPGDLRARDGRSEPQRHRSRGATRPPSGRSW